jgi:hypothetical protein
MGSLPERVENSLRPSRTRFSITLTWWTFKMDEAITYQELDSIDNPALYSEDDVVEVFIRANSGGTKLGKSDLLFSLLVATWDTATERMEELLEKLNRHGYAFDRDFVLKCCLVLLKQGSRYEVGKFRKPHVREIIEAEWERISESIRNVLDFVRSKTYLQCHKAMTTYMVLIPMIYLRYHFPDAWKTAKDLDLYLVRTSLTAAFSGQPDTIIEALVARIQETGRFDVAEAFTVLRSNGKSLELSEERLWQMGYGSDSIHLLFNLWYRDFNYTPAYENNLPQVDHIFPQSALKKIKQQNPKTGRYDMIRYHDAERNQLANCMLLTLEENGAGGKSDRLPKDWFADRPEAYLEKHLIPRDPELWNLERFDEFVFERRKLIRDKFKNLLLQEQPGVAAPAGDA